MIETTSTTTMSPGVTTAGNEGRVSRLATAAAEAAQVRALTTDPDVIALRVERVRAQVDALLWAGIVLGLAFTMVNVQSFAAAGAAIYSGAWWVAWLLDPMVSLVLLAVLRAEQVTARYQVELPAWARRTKWLTFAATYVMNTWTSWGLDGGPLSWSGVVLHSVPPLVVFATAGTGPGLRDRLTEAVRAALTDHATATTTATAVAVEATADPHGAQPGALDKPAVREPPAPPVRRVRGGTRRKTRTPRRLMADYLTDARTAHTAALASGTDVAITPAWVREVTGCSAGTSVKVAAALRAEHSTPTSASTPPSTAGTTSDVPTLGEVA
jgi:hypothetical protein